MEARQGSALGKKLKEAVKAYYWIAPTQEELDAEGMCKVVSDFPEPDVYVEDENWFAIDLYTLFSRQWRTGFNGRESLDMNVFQHALDRMNVEGDDYAQEIRNLAIIEATALEVFRSK